MEIYIQDYNTYKNKEVIIENPDEINKYILGEKLIEFVINTGDDAYCNEKEEILMEFSNGKEIRIYIGDNGKLIVYSD